MSSHERKINPARTISADARSAFKTFFNMNGITKPENNYIYSLAGFSFRQIYPGYEMADMNPYPTN